MNDVAEVKITVEHGAPDDTSQTPKVTVDNIDQLMEKITTDSPEEVYGQSEGGE